MINPTEALRVLASSEVFIRFNRGLHDKANVEVSVTVDGCLSLQEVEALYVIAKERLDG